MGIINFQGKRTAQESSENEPLLVSDYMTRKLITFKPKDSIDHVIHTLIAHRISGAPVVNEDNELIGVISEGDCLKQISESRYYNMPIDQELVVENAMAKEVNTIDGNMNIFDAINMFLEFKRRRFPIVEDGKLVGQISQKDVMKAVIGTKGTTW
ncbi:MAG: CBS domain-containing protein [Flavobacteriaceae bacterium]|nr:CBS domain-containing protein [Flavobacteriaceae bacterium]